MSNITRSYADAFFGVPGGVFRMDASRLGRAYQDGDPVQYAPDVLGRGSARQPVLAQRPLYKIADGGRPCLEFLDTFNFFLSAPDSLKIFSDEPFAVFSVIRRVNDFDRILYTWGGIATAGIYLRFRSSQRVQVYANGTSISSSVGACPEGIYIISHYSDGPQTALRLNGVEVARGASGPRSNVGDTEFRISGNAINNNSHLDGDYHDFLVYRYHFSPLGIEHIERSLARKWGIAL